MSFSDSRPKRARKVEIRRLRDDNSLFCKFQRALALKGNIRILLIDSIVGSIFYGMLNPIWQPFVLSLGASMAVLGGIRAILSLIGSVSSFFWGRRSDKMGRKPLIILSNFLRASAFTVCLAAQTWHLLVLYAVLMGLSASYVHDNPARSSLIAESVKSGERGTAYSVLMAFSTAVSAIVAPIGGILAMSYGFYVIFYGCIAVDLFSSLLVWLFIRETVKRRANKQTESLPQKSWINSIRGIFRLESHLKGFYAGVIMDSFSWGIAGGIFYGMLVKVHGFSEYQLGLLSTIMLFSWSISQIPIGKLMDKYGRKPFLLASEVIGIITLIGWLFSDNFLYFAVLQFPYGLLISTWVPTVSAFLADNVPKESRAEAMGRLQALRGIISFPSPYIGGILFDLFGFSASIIANIVGASLTFLIILLFVKEEK